MDAKVYRLVPVDCPGVLCYCYYGQYPHLYKPVLDYIRENIPTTLGQYLSDEQEVIKNSRVAMDLSDRGIEKEWFYWSKIDAPEN